MRHYFISIFTVVTLFISASPPRAWAIAEADYATVYQSKVRPYFDNHGISGTFTGAQNVPLSYRWFTIPNEKGAIVLAQGMAENSLKYAEVIYDLTQKGYSVYTMEHRNQGFSGKLTSNPQIIYVEHYDHYLEDFSTFIDKVVQAEKHENLYLLGHSMGGAISALYLEKFPKVFRAAALTAPMLEINSSPYPSLIAYWIATSACWLGFGDVYAPGQGPYQAKAFEENLFTSSEVRYAQNQENMTQNPKLAMGGVSNRWIKASMEADTAIFEHIEAIETPLLLFQAGQDHLVLPDAQDEFCAKVAQCTEHLITDSLHEILMERDLIRDLALQQTLDFFAAHASLNQPQ